MDRFLIFALERSGSSSLAAALNQDLSVVQEPFSALSGDITTNARFRNLLEAEDLLPESLPEEPGDAFAYNKFHRLARTREACDNYLQLLYRDFTGIKHVRNTVSEQGNFNILDWCLENNIKVVYLTRKKLGQALLSRFLAQQANVHNLGPEMENRGRWDNTEFQPIDVKKFQNQLDAFRQAEQKYIDYLIEQPVFFLTYEALYKGPMFIRRRKFNALCRFLSTTVESLDAASLASYLFNPQRKQTNKNAIKRLPNYHEVKRFL